MCTQLSMEDVDLITSEKKIWRCALCSVPQHSRLVLDIKANEGNLPILDLKAVLDEVKNQHIQLIKDFHIANDARNIEFEKLKKSVEDKNSKIERLMSVVDQISEENVKLRGELQMLRTQMDEMEQYSRTNDLQIDGMPEEKPEDITHVVKEIGRGLGLQINEDAIDVCHRLKRIPGREGPRGIYVRFVRETDKENFLNASKCKRNFSTKEMGRSDNCKMWIKEMLTPTQRRLLKSAKEACRVNNYKFVWTRNGKIFVKADELSSVIAIRDEEDIHRLKETKVNVPVTDERTHLLSDPVCNSSAIQRVQSDDFLAQYPNSSPKSSDEQSVLNKILQEAATNVIDVAALAPSNIEQNEYLERKNQYSSKLSPVTWQIISKKQLFLVDIAVPEKILIPTPITSQDFILVKLASSRMKSALQELKVNHTEDLIVPFEIP